VALEFVLNDLDSERIDHIVCLGDVATDGPQPREVIARLRDQGIPVVLGNMDVWALNPPPRKQKLSRIKEIQFWMVSQLSADDLDFLRTFRKTVRMSLGGARNLLCYHGSPRSNEEGIGFATSYEDLSEVLSGHHATVLAGGHTHRQMLRRFGDMIVLNPGTVGAPMPPKEAERDFVQESGSMWAEYAIVDADADADAVRIDLRRVRIRSELLIESAHESGMPNADWWLNLRYSVSVKE